MDEEHPEECKLCRMQGEGHKRVYRAAKRVTEHSSFNKRGEYVYVCRRCDGEAVTNMIETHSLRLAS